MKLVELDKIPYCNEFITDEAGFSAKALVAHKEDIDNMPIIDINTGWIKINNSDDLPKQDENAKKYDRDTIDCLVCVVEYWHNNIFDEYKPDEKKYVAHAIYDTKQKVWNFPEYNGQFAINALINENEEDFDIDCIVTHWMPYPKVPKEEEKENVY